MLPGSGGEITNITYENFEIMRPIWWSIYIGPQQQNEPGPSSDPGCLLYPLVPCETQPLVQVQNITLRNIHQYGSILPPGVIRCNETNPCEGFVWENVKAHGWWRIFGLNFIAENVNAVVTDSKPVPPFANLVADEVNADSQDSHIASVLDEFYPALLKVIEEHWRRFFSKDDDDKKVIYLDKPVHPRHHSNDRVAGENDKLFDKAVKSFAKLYSFLAN